MFKKIALGCGGLFVLVIVIIIIAAVASNGSNAPHKVSNANSTTAATTTPQGDFKVGDTISINKQTLKVNSVNTNYTTGNEFEVASAGHQYVLVNVTLHNNDSSAVDFNDFDFKLQDSAGVQVNSTIVTSDSNPLNSGSLAPNGTVTGDIVYEVTSANTSKMKLIFQPSFWDNQSATIDLN